jgi:hypothetical protein
VALLWDWQGWLLWFALGNAFFYRYDRLYKEGLIDGHDWKQHRFDFISAPKTA